jgi:hypothetical protein
MWRSSILAAGLFACLIPAGTFAQEYRRRRSAAIDFGKSVPAPGVREGATEKWPSAR